MLLDQLCRHAQFHRKHAVRVQNKKTELKKKQAVWSFFQQVSARISFQSKARMGPKLKSQTIIDFFESNALLLLVIGFGAISLKQSFDKQRAPLDKHIDCRRTS